MNKRKPSSTPVESIRHTRRNIPREEPLDLVAQDHHRQKGMSEC
jgi:hypothetical protein